MQRKIILFIMCLILAFIYVSFNPEIIKADDDEWILFKTASGAYYSFEGKNGDTIEIEKKVGEYEYRIRYVGTKLYYLTFDKRIAFMKFYEATNYYLLYGSGYDNYEKDSNTTTPYILRLDKDLTEIKYYYDTRSEVKGLSHFCDLIEYNENHFLATEFYDGVFSVGFYEGLYSLNYYDENIELISAIDCGTQECKISIAYDTIDIVDSSKKHVYFDSNFNIVETYEKEKEYIGYYELEIDLYLDDVYYSRGSIISQPGKYTLSDNVHQNRIITIKPVIQISGDKNGDNYKDYIEYKVSGGSVFIDGESSYLNGLVSSPGIHEIKVLGANDYIYSETFKIEPKLISDISDGCSIKAGSIIEFNGDGRLNGTTISSGYRIDEKGTYTLELLLGDEIVSSYTFVVYEETVKKKDIRIGFVILISAFVILLSATIVIIIREKKKREVVEEIEE